MSAATALRTGIWIGLLVWLAALLFFGALAGIGMRQMALPALVTCLAVAIITVLICRAVIVSALFVFVGIAVGYLIGRALCAACGVYSRG
jgi:hypothetical protein